MNKTDQGKRLPVTARGRTPKQLKEMAERLQTSQSRALQLAIHVMSGLTARIEQGATVVFRDTAGKETEMWLPELENLRSRMQHISPDEIPTNSELR